MKELVAFVEANEPQFIAYNVYVSDDGGTMAVVRPCRRRVLGVQHEGRAAVFRRFAHLVELSSIQIYGETSEKRWSSRGRFRGLTYSAFTGAGRS